MSTTKPNLILFSIIFIVIALVSPLEEFWQIKFVPLWTDLLIYVLVVAVLLFGIQVRHKEHLRVPWRHVLQRPLAMSALVVLGVYVLIGLMDSLHFRQALEKQQGQTETQYSGDVLSLFDVLATPIRVQQEKSYSAPFSAFLYAKETIETPEGQVRDYPRLQYGGRHLKIPAQDRIPNLVMALFLSFVATLLILLVVFVVVVFFVAHHYKTAFGDTMDAIVGGKTGIPFRAMLITFSVICFLVVVVVMLADKYHILGTDKVGNDVLYLSLKSIRTGLVIGTLTTLIMLPFAIMLGIMAGHYRGWIDDVIQYIYTTLNSIPGVLLIAAAILSLQVYLANNPEMFDTVTERADLRLLFLCLILGLTSWTGLCRLLRGETFKVSQLDYIQAATAFGTGHVKTMSRHILPNITHIVLIAIVLDFSGLVLAEAVLSYVGVGVDPTTISWGNMINSARLEMARDPVVWWSLVAAFVFMFTLVLAANLFSDAVRDAFDPRITRSK
ncbi:MAG: ABC transporter permease [Gammaproteobacteria bacterium]|nr:ABC transporter permease [Gammaproteobacteria bacterium]